MIKKIAKHLFSTLGYQVSKKEKTSFKSDCVVEVTGIEGYDYEKQGKDIIKLASNYSMVPFINLQTLYEQAIYCEKEMIPGSYVECGVWKGGSVGIMAKANLDFGMKRRHLHLFDIFDNICPPDAKVDGKKAIDDAKNILGFKNETEMKGQLESIEGGYDKRGGQGTIEICKYLLEEEINYPSKFIHYHKGWFQNTTPIIKNEIDQIAILRLDGDWYDSIKVCLENLYEKVANGGLVVIDDYGYYEGCTKAVDEFLKSRNIKTFLSYSNSNCRYFVKP